jgi:hypothetical protein
VTYLGLHDRCTIHPPPPVAPVWGA